MAPAATSKSAGPNCKAREEYVFCVHVHSFFVNVCVYGSVCECVRVWVSVYVCVYV